MSKWTKDHNFAPLGSITVDPNFLTLYLSFAGVSRNGGRFLVTASQAPTGWTMIVTMDGTERGTYNSENTDLRAAVIDAVERFDT